MFREEREHTDKEKEEGQHQRSSKRETQHKQNEQGQTADNPSSENTLQTAHRQRQNSADTGTHSLIRATIYIELFVQYVETMVIIYNVLRDQSLVLHIFLFNILLFPVCIRFQGIRVTCSILGLPVSISEEKTTKQPEQTL